MFLGWRTGLPHDVETVPVQLPGLEARLLEPPFLEMPRLVEAVEQAISRYTATPFAFFGHSMGALVAFEVARFLRRHGGVTPELLVVSACRAPHLSNADPPVHHLSDAALVEKLRTLGGTPEAILRSNEVMRVVLPRLRADLQICATYAYEREPPLSCPILALGGLDDTRVGRTDLAGWRVHTTGAFALRLWAGNHFFLKSAEASVLKAVGEELIRT